MDLMGCVLDMDFLFFCQELRRFLHLATTQFCTGESAELFDCGLGCVFLFLVEKVATVQAIHISKVVSTHLWNTPLNLYQQAIKGFLS